MITKHPFEFVKFDDGTFGVRGALVNGYEFYCLDKSEARGFYAWVLREYIEKKCHMKKPEAKKCLQLVVAYFYNSLKPLDLGTPVE